MLDTTGIRLISKARWLAVACFLPLAAGCAASWTATTGAYQNDDLRYTVTTPMGWFQKEMERYTVFTRNDRSLETMSIAFIRWQDSLPDTRTYFKRDMLLHEHARFYLKEVRSSRYVYNLQLASQDVVTLGSMPAARIEYTFLRSNALPVRSITLVCPVDKGVYLIDYTAPERYYFAKYKSDFDSLAASFRFQ